jgi:hypothetical protein
MPLRFITFRIFQHPLPTSECNPELFAPWDEWRLSVNEFKTFMTVASRCMSPFQPDFDPDSLHPSTMVVKTMGGALKMNQMEGTLQWSGVTDAGLETKFPLENSVSVPHGDTHIFSPQHWAQNMFKLYPKCEADERMCGGNKFIMSWKLDNVLHIITMPIAPHNNVAHIYVNMPDDSYSACVAAAGLSDDQDPITLNPSPC